MDSSDRTLFLIGTGPGNGRAISALFASKRYNRVALFARRAEQLKIEADALTKALGANAITVKTWAVDVTDADSLLKVLGEADEELGMPECVYYNAARVLPSALLTHPVEDLEYDLKVELFPRTKISFHARKATND